MPFIAPELIIQAKQMDLLTYLRNYEPYELVKFSGNTYCTRTHDSLKISNGKWIWWSRGIGGRSALDYLIKVKGYSFLEAVETIIGHTAIQAPVYEKPQPKEENKPLLLPEKCASNRVITEYLFGRGIDFEIINYCISNDLIFESLPYHNVVFVGYDEKKEPKYAAYRSTNKRRIMGDCSGSKKDYSFRLGKENLEEVHLFECAIDLFIKNPVVAEFLGFSQNTDFTESDLEKSILSNLQKFLMELGKGYAFVARQQHIHTEKQDYYIDLVFYNYILKCFVLIDLKTEKITHQDVGQMDMYIRMYDELKRSEGDNPTIGIVLCSDTDDDIARYSVMHGNEQLFASKYKLYLPTKEELKAEIETQKAMFYLQLQDKRSK